MTPMPSPARRFPLPPLPRRALLVLAALPLLLLPLVLLASRQSTGPQLLPAAITVAAVLLVTLALKRRRVVLDGRQLQVAATLYTRRIDVDALDLERARVVDLAERTELSPQLKLNGYSLPGFKAGHFRLRNRAYGFCLLIGDGRALVLPQRDGKYLLLSVSQPQVLLDELRRVAGPAPGR